MDFLDDVIDEVLEDDYFIDAQMMANSREEALDLVGDDTFYTGSDSLEDDEDEIFTYIGSDCLTSDQEDQLRDAGLDPDDLTYMDDDEIREVLEDAGLDIDDFMY